MKYNPSEIRAAIAALEARRLAATEMHERVVDLLSRAEERRHAEPAEARRWNAVIDRLEASLQDARRRLEVLDLEYEHAVRALAAAGEPDAASRPDLDLPDAVAPQMPDLSSDPAVAVRQLLDLPIEQLTGLNLEQVSQLHSQIATENVQARLADLDKASNRLEIANQSVGHAGGSPSGISVERRSQDALRHAIGKVQAGQLTRLDRKEIAMVISCFELLDRKIEPTASDQRLRGLLSPVVPKLRQLLRSTAR